MKRENVNRLVVTETWHAHHGKYQKQTLNPTVSWENPEI